MKLTFSCVATAFAAVLVKEAITAFAIPVQTLEVRQVQLDVGQVQLCSLHGKCLATFRIPQIEEATLCITLTEDFQTEFLENNLKTMTFNGASCSAFGGFDCRGTNFGGDVAPAGTTVTVDYSVNHGPSPNGGSGNGTSPNGGSIPSGPDASFIESIQCTFL